MSVVKGYTYYMMKKIPLGTSLVVLVGPSGSGKSTFAEKYFHPHEIVSADALRIELAGDMARQDKNDAVFTEFHRRIKVRLSAQRRVVADATHLRNAERKRTAEIGLVMEIPVTYVIINRSVVAKMQTGGWRNDVRMKNGYLIEVHEETFKANEAAMLAGDNTRVSIVDTRSTDFEVVQELPRGFDDVLPVLMDRGFNKIRVVGDVHGNLMGLDKAMDVTEGTFLLFLGDIVDYGVDTLVTARMVSALIRDGRAACIRGNHERKIYNFVVQERGGGFRGQASEGNNVTLNQLKALDFNARLSWEEDFLSMVELSPDVIEIDQWLFTHAAAHPSVWGKTIHRLPRNSALESFALYGETTGKYVDGFPERLYNWVDKIPTGKRVVVGHAVRSTDDVLVQSGEKGGKAYFLDTGSSKEGHLSWMDFDIVQTRKSMKLEFKDFGRE